MLREILAERKVDEKKGVDSVKLVEILCICLFVFVYSCFCICICVFVFEFVFVFVFVFDNGIAQLFLRKRSLR